MGTRQDDGTFLRVPLGWKISYAGREIDLLDAKGLRYLARLLERPGEPIPALELARGDATSRDWEDHERARKAVRNRIAGSIEQIAELHPELGIHLRLAIRTGTSCCYRPSLRVRWTT